MIYAAKIVFFLIYNQIFKEKFCRERKCLYFCGIKHMSNIVYQETVKIDSSQYKGAFGETNYYGIDGIQGKKQSKGLVIVNGKDEKNTGQTKKCYGKILLIR